MPLFWTTPDIKPKSEDPRGGECHRSLSPWAPTQPHSGVCDARLCAADQAYCNTATEAVSVQGAEEGYSGNTRNFKLRKLLYTPDVLAKKAQISSLKINSWLTRRSQDPRGFCTQHPASLLAEQDLPFPRRAPSQLLCLHQGSVCSLPVALLLGKLAEPWVQQA